MANQTPLGASHSQRLPLPQAMKLAFAHQEAGKLGDAEAVLRQVLKAQPQHAQANHLLGLIAHQTGRSELAVKLIRDAIAVRPTAGLFHLNLCEILRQARRAEEAVGHGRESVRLMPDSADALSNLGVASFAAGDVDEAERCQQQALARNANLPQTLNNLGSIYRQRQNAVLAEDYYRRAIVADPANVEALNNLGALLVEQERPGEAKPLLLKTVQLAPQYADAHLNMGALFLLEEDNVKARFAFNQAVKFNPSLPEALVGLGIIHLHAGELLEAESVLQRALTLKPRDVAALNQLGLLYTEMGHPNKALAAFDRAISENPDAEDPRISKAYLLIQLGELEAASELLNATIARLPGSISARLAMVKLKKVKPVDEALRTLEAEHQRIESLRPANQVPLLIGLGKCYDDIGEHERAFEHYLRGCAVKRASIDYDSANNTALVDRIIATLDAAAIERAHGAGDPSDLPIFVLGMPRSGTTLTEQIIASHSACHGAGELPDLLQTANRRGVSGDQTTYPASVLDITEHELAGLGASYVFGLKARNPEAARITDKMPANFYCVGLIHMILPKAKIIHVMRNPVDTCISGISKLFKNGQFHSYNLTEQGQFYVNYDRLMKHWRAVLPATAYHEVQYEALVENTEVEARALIEYCGLEWEPACLDFHKTERAVKTASVAQVRQPIYKTSLERWRRYEKHVGPLFDALGDLAPARDAKT